jgi:hypothetical protein
MIRYPPLAIRLCPVYTKQHGQDLKTAPGADPARKQAVTYARVSSKEQEKEGFSIPAQLKLLKEYAAAQGFAVVQEYVDIETAKQTGRTAFGEMVGYLKEHPAIRAMLVEKTDRLYRNLKDWVTVDELDVEIHFPSQISDLAELGSEPAAARVAIAVVCANKSNGSLKAATTSPFSQEQFDSKKLSSRRFSRGSCRSNSFRALLASSRIWTPSSM